MNGCVVCHRPLYPVAVNSVDVDGCLAGHGLWIDEDELTRAFHLDLVDRAINEICNMEGAAGQGLLEGERKCPRCDHALQVLGVDTIELDRCCFCRGLWLDSDELRELYAVEGMLRNEMCMAMLRTTLIEKGPALLLEIKRGSRTASPPRERR